MAIKAGVSITKELHMATGTVKFFDQDKGLNLPPIFGDQSNTEQPA